MLRRMGPLQGVLKLIPGIGKQLEGLDDVDEQQLGRVEAIILSMTPHERRVPHVIDGSRRKRIAAGSGTTVTQVNQLHRGPQADGEDDEGDGFRQDALAPGNADAGRERKAAPERDPQVRKQTEEESEKVIRWQ